MELHPREEIVAANADRYVVIVLSNTLGTPRFSWARATTFTIAGSASDRASLRGSRSRVDDQLVVQTVGFLDGECAACREHRPAVGGAESHAESDEWTVEADHVRHRFIIGRHRSTKRQPERGPGARSNLGPSAVGIGPASFSRRVGHRVLGRLRNWARPKITS